MSGYAPIQVAGLWLALLLRASTGTYIDDTGVMQIAPANTARADYSTGAETLLVEGASANQFAFSEALTAGITSPGLYGAGTFAGVTQLQANSALLKVYDAPLGTSQPLVFNYTAPGASSPISQSVYVWIPASFTGSAISVAAGAGLTAVTSHAADLTKRNQWQRIRLCGVGTAGTFTIQVTTGSVSDDFYLTCPQVEFSATVSSYIPAMGAVAARAADVPYYIPQPEQAVYNPPAARDPDTVLEYLLALSPDGDALDTADDSFWRAWFKPLAAEISRFENQAVAMLSEVDPGQANYLLADYERVLGPDPYGRDATALTLADRRALAHSRWVERYGVRPQDFIALAASFGETITIQEYELTECGSAQAGVCLVGHPVEFAWLVNFPNDPLEVAEASGCEAGDLLGFYEPSLVEPVIAARAPAHTNPYFAYA